MVDVTQKGDFSKTIQFLQKMKKQDARSILNHYGKLGVELLSKATPTDTGKTASSWRYELKGTKDRYVVEFFNDNVQNEINIAIILQYGHGTRNGGYVRGTDYINPAINQAFSDMVNDLWKEVVQA